MKEKVNFDALPPGSSFNYGTSIRTWFKAAEVLESATSVFSLAGSYFENIARGTTDPEIDSVTWIKFINNMAPLALVANLATRWRHLH